MEFHMKKLVGFIAIIMMLTLFLTASSFAATKYDAMFNDPQIKGLIKKYDETMPKTRVLREYINLLVNKNDIIRIANSGALDKEKSKFLSENASQFLKVYQGIILIKLYQQKWEYTDAQYQFFIGIIKDPYAQVAKNGPEYEMEKEVWRAAPPYAVWENYREDGFIEKEINAMLDGVYIEIQKQKKGKR